MEMNRENISGYTVRVVSARSKPGFIGFVEEIPGVMASGKDIEELTHYLRRSLFVMMDYYINNPISPELFRLEKIKFKREIEELAFSSEEPNHLSVSALC